ncbi:MAG TPA: mechanosensitive ion channel domain-containing protein, partial [Actinomycetes bacterium]|nr:mechanosensitive ion channel domain-containing protein [Actinomycetes bacterium]
LATVALGFALQDIVGNFTAGIVLLLEHPFTEGDHISVAEAEGEVEEIRIRATRLRAPDGQLVMVPNKLLFTGVLTNFSAAMRRRVEVLLEVPYGQDLVRARELLLATAAEVEGVSQDPPPRLLTRDLAQGARGVEGQGGHHHHDVSLGVGAPQRPLHPPAHDPGHQHGEGDGDQRGQQVGQPVDEPVDEVLEGVAEGVAKALQRRAS